MDFSAAALGSATAAAARLGPAERAQFRLGDLSRSGLPAGSADAVLGVDAIHFAESVVEAVAECRRILKPDGLLVIMSWAPAGAEAGKRLPARLARMDLERDLAAGASTT